VDTLKNFDFLPVQSKDSKK